MAKKKTSFFNKIVFLINTIFAIGLVMAFLLPYLSPKEFCVISLLSLLVPILIVANILFVLYWIMIGFKKQMLQSFIVLVISYFFLPPLYIFNNDQTSIKKETISLMTYNVRKFNLYGWLDITNIEDEIKQVIIDENPDIVAIQEYRNFDKFNLKYPFSSKKITDKNVPSSLVIYSKYPIINKGNIASNSRAIYVDIVKKNDTLRIYNFHLETTGVVPEEDYIGIKKSEKLIKRLRNSFKSQQEQIEVLNKHIKESKYKVIVVGDMNNTAYSWAYKNLRNNFKDTFLEAGEGFGKTYEFKKFPLRIDFIFTDKHFHVRSHEILNVKYSDHYPVKAILEL